MSVRPGFISGGARVPQLPGTVFYACERWPDCDTDPTPQHQHNPHDPPYCPTHRTTPMTQEVRKRQDGSQR